MKINHEKIKSMMESLEKYPKVKINYEKIKSMMESLEKYPGVLPLAIFHAGPFWPYYDEEKKRRGYVVYRKNLYASGLFEELYWELAEEKMLSGGLTLDQEGKHIAEWVDKLQNHPELLSDAEREWVKNNPEYKEIVIK